MDLDDLPSEHREADPGCTADWCGVHGYPKPCQEPGCPGLVHAAFGDYSSYDSYWLYTRCDVCGESE